MPKKLLVFAALTLASVAGCQPQRLGERWPQTLADAQRVENLGQGKFLIAAPEILDPYFSKTVILLLHYSARSAAGVIVNRPGSKRYAEAFGDQAHPNLSNQVLFVGGPVGASSVIGLLGDREPPEGSSTVLRGCHLISDAQLLRRLLEKGVPQERFRIYLGYAGWRAGQLEKEIRAGQWLVVPASPELVFDPHPETLWDRLISKLQQVLARLT